MTFNPKRLQRDAERLLKTRPPSTVGRESTGTTSAIRVALPVIYQLRKDLVPWSVIADALAAQGIVQGRDRIPLTTNRLTALVSQIEEQERRKVLKADNRARGGSPKRVTRSKRHLSLSPDLARQPTASETPSSIEDDLRRAAYEKLQNLLKKE